MAPTKQRRRGHDRGDVLVDLAVMVADGGESISDLAVLRDQPDLFGEVASHPTAWRALAAVDDATLERINRRDPKPAGGRGRRVRIPGSMSLIWMPRWSVRTRRRRGRRRHGNAGSGFIVRPGARAP